MPLISKWLFFGLLVFVAAVTAQNIGNGVNLKFNFTAAREVHEPDNKYFQAAKEYMDWILDNSDANGRFPSLVNMPSMEIEKYSDINHNNKAVMLSCHLSYIMKDSARYYTPLKKYIKHDLRTIVKKGWPSWGEAGANGEHKEPDPRRNMFFIDPFYSEDISMGYWINGIGDKQTGDFNRHASCTSTGASFINEGGARYNHWITAYTFTWIEEYLHYFDVLVNWYEGIRSPEGWPVGEGSVGTEARMYYLEEAVKALPYIPEDNPLRDKLREHIDKSIEGPISFDIPSHEKTLKHKNNCMHAYYDMYLHHLDRGDTVRANKYLELLVKNADAFIDYQPEKNTWAWTVGLTMRLYTNAYYATGESKYLDKAKELGDHSIESYLDLGPLPRDTFREGYPDHYENDATTWGDFLMLQLLELGLAVDENYGRGHKILWTHIR